MARSARRLTLCVIVPALLSIGCHSKQAPSTTANKFQLPTFPIHYAPPPPPPPRYGWKRLFDTEFELQALEYRRFDLPPKGLIRVSVNADSGVFGGAFDRDAVLSYVQSQRNQLRQNDFAAAPCSLVAVIRGETECRTDDYIAPLTYIIRDKRSEMAMAGGLWSFLHGGERGVERATDPNRVNVTIDVWDCIANCPAPAQSATSSRERPDAGDTSEPAGDTQ